MTVMTEQGIRSMDPYGIVKEWRREGALVLKVWKKLDLDHGITPAKAFVLSVEENGGNVVTLLTHLSIAQGEKMDIFTWNKDGEYILATCMGYGTNQFDRYRWLGTLAQWIGSSYQYSLEKIRGLPFNQAFHKFTGGQVESSTFTNRYELYAWLINYRLGTTYPLRPNSNGYYTDFRVTRKNRQQMIQAVEWFFQIMDWPFKDPNFFKEKGQPSIVNYDALESASLQK